MLDRINKSFRYSVVSGAFLITKARVAVLCGSSCDGFSSLHEYQRDRIEQDHVLRCFVICVVLREVRSQTRSFRTSFFINHRYWWFPKSNFPAIMARRVASRKGGTSLECFFSRSLARVRPRKHKFTVFLVLEQTIDPDQGGLNCLFKLGTSSLLQHEFCCDPNHGKWRVR